MEFGSLFLTLAVLSVLAALTPGPDFIVVTKNSVLGSRTIGVATAFGVGLGILTHVAYSLLGIGFIISQSIVAFSIIKYLGAAYLLYLGWQLLRTQPNSSDSLSPRQTTLHITRWGALKEGFLTNSLNPKATLFFLSIFTQLVDPTTPLFVQGLLGLEVAAIVTVWFSVVSILMTHSYIATLFVHIQQYVMKCMGVALILLGIRLAFESK